MEHSLKILVWPGFSVVGLEIAEQLRFMKDVEIFSGTSTLGHPLTEMFSGVVEIPNLRTSTNKLDQSIINEFIVFPAHDYVLDYIFSDSRQISWIGSSKKTIELSRNKAKMYKYLDKHLSAYSPLMFESKEEALENLPVYAKPNSGYGSQGHQLVHNEKEFDWFLSVDESLIFMEVLHGDEYTVECLTSNTGELVHVFARKRIRVRMGTSLSFASPDEVTMVALEELANLLNRSISFNGPWYFQVKERTESKGDFKVLEVSTRLPGSSVWSRANGVNLAEMSIWNYRGKEIKALKNSCGVVVERELSSKMLLQHPFENVYIDLDETILVNGKVSHWAVAFLIQERNKGKGIHLLTKSLTRNIDLLLSQLNIIGLFDSISHLDLTEKKSHFMLHASSIFIDDSFSERQEMRADHGIPCFGPDVFQLLVK